MQETVSVYPVSAEGLGDPRHYQAQYADGSRQSADLLSQDLWTAGNQIAMEKLAKDTGGEAFYNTNDLADAITRAIDDGSRYYTLAYSPGDKTSDGKFRTINVWLEHENYKLSYRRGYYADAPKPQDDSDRDPSNDHLLPLRN
jgi:VWFA-related protein